MLSISSKSHYLFNLQNILKVIQSICSLAKNKISRTNDLIEIWAHESTPIFNDRLVDGADQTSFHELIAE
jgi:dynein heavy chain